MDPAALFEARSMCGLTHGRFGKCDDLAMECADYMEEKYHASKPNQQENPNTHNAEPKPKPKPKPKPDNQNQPHDPKDVGCNPDFDPRNTTGPYDQPCL